MGTDKSLDAPVRSDSKVVFMARSTVKVKNNKKESDSREDNSSFSTKENLAAINDSNPPKNKVINTFNKMVHQGLKPSQRLKMYASARQAIKQTMLKEKRQKRDILAQKW